jgi:hypothetical protein
MIFGDAHHLCQLRLRQIMLLSVILHHVAKSQADHDVPPF